jgi:hypothetical protein
MLALVHSDCLARVAGGIAEETLRLPHQYRFDYIWTSLDQEVQSARSLCWKTALTATRACYGIIDVLTQLGVEDPWIAMDKIDNRSESHKGRKLRRILQRCKYGTAHQAIRAMTEIGTVQAAVQRYHEARQDSARAQKLCDGIAALQRSLRALADHSYVSWWTPITPYLKRHANKLAKGLPGLAWCFLEAAFKAA